MTCECIRNDLNAFVDEQLSETASQQVEQHLHSCAECRDRLLRLHRLTDLLSEVPIIPPPESLTSRVLSAARRELAANVRSPAPATSSTPGWTGVTPLYAAALLALAVGLCAGTWMARDTWDQPESEEGMPRNRIAQDIGSFYGAGSDLDAHQPLPQVYLTFVDRNGSGE